MRPPPTHTPCTTHHAATCLSAISACAAASPSSAPAPSGPAPPCRAAASAPAPPAPRSSCTPGARAARGACSSASRPAPPPPGLAPFSTLRASWDALDRASGGAGGLWGAPTGPWRAGGGAGALRWSLLLPLLLLLSLAAASLADCRRCAARPHTLAAQHAGSGTAHAAARAGTVCATTPSCRSVSCTGVGEREGGGGSAAVGAARSHEHRQAQRARLQMGRYRQEECCVLCTAPIWCAPWVPMQPAHAPRLRLQPPACPAAPRPPPACAPWRAPRARQWRGAVTGARNPLVEVAG